MNLSLTNYFMIFFIYAVCGWLLEVTCKFVEFKRFINRGFLIGPYCPIYGWGAVAITKLLYKYNDDMIALFILTTVTCGILEYLTSLVMEKLFKARWWDYSKRKFNINGRVCLGTMIPFGIFGVILTYITNPFIINILGKIDTNILNVVALILLLGYLVDNVISGIVIFGFRKTAVSIGKEGSSDDTEQITKKVKEILLKKSWAYRRLINAYPMLITLKDKIKEIKDDVKENAIEVKNTINEKATEMKNSINEKAAEMKNSINEKTDAVAKSIGNSKRKLTVSYKWNKRNIKSNFKGKIRRKGE